MEKEQSLWNRNLYVDIFGDKEIKLTEDSISTIEHCINNFVKSRKENLKERINNERFSNNRT